ncbi:hypothetical protein KP79_PYT09317 [Mizuhopecten yessoensis]|uniref:Uncharacterized protein n=1 Tax=Mizuhopecten yessoensis TaxID=6573 RepID=A0A210QCB5_MIZYE|nr:hypothetical protein KP79_PYT09317 [Mizuhopecten yessoensis]
MLDSDSEHSTGGLSRSPSPNQRIPMRRGSNAFQLVLKELNFSDDESLTNLDPEIMKFLDGISRKQLERNSQATILDSPDGSECEECPKWSTDTKEGKKRGTGRSSTRRRGSKHHVQWVDERYIVPVAYEPDATEKHAARIYIKTIPKSILKHVRETSGKRLLMTK